MDFCGWAHNEDISEFVEDEDEFVVAQSEFLEVGFGGVKLNADLIKCLTEMSENRFDFVLIGEHDGDVIGVDDYP